MVGFTDGERFPMLIRRNDGLPLFAPTEFSITSLRPRNQASETIEHALRAIMLLYIVGGRYGIDVEKRIATGEFFTTAELDMLAREVRQPFKSLAQNTI